MAAATAVVASFATWGLSACAGGADAAKHPPAAEFLMAAGDSTFWVRSGDEGVQVRSAPILLTRVGGTYYEVFITEDGVDYADAGFASARIFARDITRQDSLVLFDEGTVMREATAWKKRHPDEEAIDPDNEELPDDPGTLVSEEIEILDVHGPWVTFNHLLDIDIAAEDGDSIPHRHEGKRYVVDVRTGAKASLATLFGATEARRLIDAARTSFTQLTDSIRATGDDRADMARETLESFRFDSSSFGITNIARKPAVAFLVPGNGVDGEALALNLPPIAAAAPEWWTDVLPTLPTWSPDSSEVRWPRRGYDVVARGRDDGEALALALVPSRATDTEWPVATVPAPTYALVPLDEPVISAAVRTALARAFDVSSTLSGARQVAAAGGAQWRRVMFVAPVDARRAARFGGGAPRSASTSLSLRLHG